MTSRRDLTISSAWSGGASGSVVEDPYTLIQQSETATGNTGNTPSAFAAVHGQEREFFAFANCNSATNGSSNTIKNGTTTLTPQGDQYWISGGSYDRSRNTYIAQTLTVAPGEAIHAESVPYHTSLTTFVIGSGWEITQHVLSPADGSQANVVQDLVFPVAPALGSKVLFCIYEGPAGHTSAPSGTRLFWNGAEGSAYYYPHSFWEDDGDGSTTTWTATMADANSWAFACGIEIRLS